MNIEILNKIVFYFLVALAIFILIGLIIDNRKPKVIDEKDNVVEIIKNPLTLGNYENLINYLKTIQQQIATAKELEILINKNAEVQSSVVDGYPSFEYLSIWRDSFLAQIKLNYIFTRDNYNSVEANFPTESKKIVETQLYDIKRFINQNC